MSESILFTPCNLGPVTLRNRTIRSAAFENMAYNHNPSESLYNYHVSVAKGGIGMTTVAYASVCKSGLSFENQLLIREEIVPGLTKLTDAIHAEGAKASIQLGHCGNMSHRRLTGCTPFGACSGFNMYSPTFVHGISEKEMIEVAKSFGKATKLVIDSGFDAIELHCGHGYLISQFLSPFTNHRHDIYGGSLENRMRFMEMCVSEVQEVAQGKIAVTAKVNTRDGFKGGMDIDECIEVSKKLQEMGLHGLTLSGGFVSCAPMYVMRGEMPIRTLTYYMTIPWLRWCLRMFGKMAIPTVPFEQLYFLEDSLKFRKALDIPLIYVGGVVSRQNIEDVLNNGFEFVSMARALVREPGFVNRMMKEDGSCKCDCDHINYCIGRMYTLEMKCHKNIDNLPPCLIKEIEQIKERDKKRKN